MSKRIIYIGDFEQKFDTERYVAHAFKELGYDVLCLSENRISVNNLPSMLHEIIEYNPEFVLFSKGRPQGEVDELVKLLKTFKIKTITWLFDLYFGLKSDRINRLKSGRCPYNSDIIISTDGGHQKEFGEIGIKHICVRQGIHKPEAILYEKDKVHDIIFVGGDYFNNRGWLLNGLKDKYGSKFETFGFPEQIRNLPLNELYASTKIVVGDSQPSPNYWSNRIYETLGRGGFLIHPKVEGLEKEFEDKVHLVLYERENIEELTKLIDYYLEHEEEREKIRKAGFEHVRDNYTYEDRCKELLSKI